MNSNHHTAGRQAAHRTNRNASTVHLGPADRAPCKSAANRCIRRAPAYRFAFALDSACNQHHKVHKVRHRAHQLLKDQINGEASPHRPDRTPNARNNSHNNQNCQHRQKGCQSDHHRLLLRNANEKGSLRFRSDQESSSIPLKENITTTSDSHRLGPFDKTAVVEEVRGTHRNVTGQTRRKSGTGPPAGRQQSK